MKTRNKEQKSLRIRNIYLNSGITFASQILQVLIGFAVRRLFVLKLGSNYLGYDSVFLNILQMLNIADLGISVAITSFLYKPLAEGNSKVVTALMHLYKRVYQLIGGFVLVLGLGISCFLPVLIPDAVCSIGELRLFFFINLTGVVSTYYLAYKRTLLVADQKSYFIVSIDTVFFFIASIFQIAILFFYPNYVLYLITITIKNILSNIIISIGCNRKYNYINGKVDKKISEIYKPQIITYVKDLFISKIGAYVFYGTDHLVVSVFSGSLLAGYLSNYSMVTQQVNNMITQILSSIQAVFGNFISVTRDKEEQRKMTDNYFFVNSFLGIFCMLCVMFLVQPFVRLFFGRQYVLENSTVFWAAVNLMLTIMIQLPSQVFMIYKLYHYDRPIIVISASFNIIISIVLVRRLGIDGVLIGTFITSLIYLFSRFYIIGSRVFEISYWHYIYKVCIYFAVAGVSLFILNFSTGHIYVDSAVGWGLKAIIVIILALLVPMCFLVVTDEFKIIVGRMFPRWAAKVFSKIFIWCFTAIVITIAVLYSDNVSESLERNKSLYRSDVYMDENIDCNKKIFHLSFDDVIDIFKDLTIHEKEYDSIFKNKDLQWMKEIHEKYGCVISCYVFYQDDTFCLDECTEKFKSEFEDNKDWLRFGFHCLDSRTIYGESGNSNILEDYNRTVKSLKKIMGEGIDHTIRLQSYQASKEEVIQLMENGIEPIAGLLCADDLRQNYYLNSIDNTFIYCHDEYKDLETGIQFYSTDLRIEYIRSIGDKINEFSTDSWNNQLGDLIVFTHEWLLDQEIKEKIEIMCRYALDRGYEFVFFDEVN